jgi:type I restriction enzyme, S subunit
MKPYPKYKDSGVEWIGNVPEGWGVSKLKWFSKIYSGTNIKNELGTYPLYGANGIIGKCIIDSFATEKVIIGRVGSSGEINFATGIYGVSDNALVVDNSKDITSKFLFYFLTTINFSTDITLNAQPLLTATNVKNKFVAIPNSNPDFAL